MSKLELNISNTALGTSGCMLALKRTIVDGYVEPAQDSNLVYGVAVHKYIDTMYKTNGHIPTAREEALKAFNIPKNNKSKQMHLSDANHMLTTCFNVWELYVKQDSNFEVLMLNDKPATEVTFSIPYFEDEAIKVNLCGTIDSIGKIKGGCYAIRDWKTTSSWDNKGYFKSYELSRQLRLYVMALGIMSTLHPESILGTIGNTRVGAFIDALFIKPAANDNKYYRSEMFSYTHEELCEFKLMLDIKLKEFSLAVQHNYFPKQGIINGACNRQYGKCSFWNTCVVSSVIAEVLLARDFKKKEFNPLDYNGGLIET